jgi:phosphoglucosamine mutase
MWEESLSKLFGTSGIRDIANLKISPQLVVQVGQALATYTKAKKILTAMDTRTTSPMLQYGLVAGITACGANVLQQGLVPTPVLAYLTGKTGADAGVMITASHNTPEYNGIKLYNPDTTAFSQVQQDKVESLISKKQFKLAEWHDVGKTIDIDETPQYTEMIKAIRLRKPWKLILDPGNGTTGLLAPRIFLDAGCTVVAVNSQPDGHFPGRGPEPDQESLKALCSMVRSLRADAGIAYDGDGDRMVAVDEKGRVTPPDQSFAAYAGYVVSKGKNKTVVTHVEASMCVERMVEAEGGKTIRTKVGDVSITEAVKRSKAGFGGEPCGAWIHPDYHYCPDGILSSILLLRALEETGLGLSEFVAKAPKYPIFRKNIQCSNSAKDAVLQKASETFPRIFTSIKDQSTLDGLRLVFPEGWLLLRPSGTEPLIRITVEGETAGIAKQMLQKAVKEVLRLVEEAKT